MSTPACRSSTRTSWAATFPWIAQPITNLVPQAAGAVHALGMAAPFLQIGFGLGLLTRNSGASR